MILNPAARLSPLTALNQLGLTNAGAVLLADARKLAKTDPDLAARFHAAALQPARSELLATLTMKEASNGQKRITRPGFEHSESHADHPS